MKSGSSKETRTQQRAKFFLAFSFKEQLTRATESLLSLAALAKYGDRDVVIPFVKNSKFYGTKLDENTGTLSRYFDVEELNRKLDSHGYGLLTSWEHFQKHCNGRLDVLLEMHYYSNYSIYLSNSQRLLLKNTGWAPYFALKRFQGFQINRTIFIDPAILTSFQQLESDVLQGASCVAFVAWMGVGAGRSHFSLPLDRGHLPFSVRHDLPLNSNLLRIAQDFAARKLGSNYISVHIRSEWVLLRHKSNMSSLFECIRELSSRVQITKKKTGLKRIFLATDFSRFGSKSSSAWLDLSESKMLFEYVGNLLRSTETFDPDIVGLSDRGSVAIVELSILSAGKKLFVVGGGNFEDWIKYNYEKASLNTAEKICYRERPENKS